MASGIAVKLPLKYDNDDGPYLLTKTLAETVKQNFKNLLLTVPGERIMMPEFGIGVHGFLFENDTSPGLQEDFAERVHDQVARHLPFVAIEDILTGFKENTWHIQISYFIKPLGISDTLSLNLAEK